jgi:hypothetical protein
MPYSIYRAQKLKTIVQMRASVAHNSRSRPTQNANPALTSRNKQLLGFAGKIPTSDEFESEWQRLTASVLRKRDAVLVEELLLTTSPEYFLASDPADRQAKIDAWVLRSVDWLSRTFGDLCFSATLHVDETTPHVAAYVVPICTAKNGEKWLSAKKLFSPLTLRGHQDTYSSCLSDLGLERGVRGSVARHQSVQSFYASISKPTPGDALAATVRKTPLDLPTRGFFQGPSEYEQTVKKAVEDYIRPICATAHDLANKGLAVETVRRESAAVRKANQVLSERLRISEASLKERVDQLRDIPAAQILEKLGFGTGKSEGGVTVWETGDHRIRVTGIEWHDEKGGKTGRKSIDLVKHLQECDYVEAVSWLAGSWSTEETTGAIRAAAPELAVATPKKNLRTLWAYYSKPALDATQAVQQFLSDKHGIHFETTEPALKSGSMYASRQERLGQNPRIWTVFNHLRANGKIGGGTLRAIEHGEPVHRYIGDRTESFFEVRPQVLTPKTLALVEDPISALSYFQLHPSTRVLSAGGPRIPQALADIVAKSNLDVEFALNRGKTQENEWVRLLKYLRDGGFDPRKLLQKLKRAYPLVHGAYDATWNDVLLPRNELSPPQGANVEFQRERSSVGQPGKGGPSWS